MSDAYGRYVDPSDGQPRWNLPPSSSPYKTAGERLDMMKEAIAELYADHGSAFVARRLGLAVDYGTLERIAHMARNMGLRVSARGRAEFRSQVAKTMARKWKTERVRADYGLPRLTRLAVDRFPKKGWAARRRLHDDDGYLYGDPPCEMLYDANTRRRLAPRRKLREYNRFMTEADLERRWGFVFKPAGGEP